MKQPPSRVAFERGAWREVDHVREIRLLDRHPEIGRQVGRQSRVARLGAEKQLRDVQERVLAIKVIEASLQLEHDAVQKLIAAAALQLEELLHAGFDVPREIQLATEVHGEKRVGLPHMEKGKAAVGWLEQRSDVALRCLGDVDDR